MRRLSTLSIRFMSLFKLPCCLIFELPSRCGQPRGPAVDLPSVTRTPPIDRPDKAVHGFTCRPVIGLRIIDRCVYFKMHRLFDGTLIVAAKTMPKTINWFARPVAQPRNGTPSSWGKASGRRRGTGVGANQKRPYEGFLLAPLCSTANIYQINTRFHSVQPLLARRLAASSSRRPGKKRHQQVEVQLRAFGP
jgi:hypothetical protein